MYPGLLLRNQSHPKHTHTHVGTKYSQQTAARRAPTRMFSTGPQSLKNSLMSSSLADHARFLINMVELPCAADVSTFAAGATLAFFASGAACRPHTWAHQHIGQVLKGSNPTAHVSAAKAPSCQVASVPLQKLKRDCTSITHLPIGFLLLLVSLVVVVVILILVLVLILLLMAHSHVTYTCNG